MTPALAGAALGLAGSGGVLLAVASSPPVRRPRLQHRMEPYLRDALRPSRLLDDRRALTPFPTLERLLAPALRDLAGFVERVLGGSSSVRRRLERCGGRMTVEQFRVEQVLWAAAGVVGAFAVVGFAAANGRLASPLAVLVLCSVAALAGALCRDRALSVAAARREQRLLQEFPTVAELLALAVGAGEGAAGALERVVRLTSGELAFELSRALASARAGASLVTALEAMAARTAVPALERFVEGMAIAVDRGTPLAEVLRAQAVDVREQHRRALLEVGGRKEIAMLTPVVFLVLPVTVVFALFPGFYNLSLTVP